MKLDLDHVIAFRAVAAEGSFTRAAATLNSCQSRMSAKVKALEERLGTRLFARSTRFVELTRSGQLLLTYADQLAATVAEIEAVADKLWRSDGQILRIGVPGCTAMTPERAILTDLLEHQQPSIRIEIEEALPAALLERLHRHQIDLAIIPGPLSCGELELHPLRVVSNMLVLSEDHILARFESIPPERMRGQQIVFSSREIHPALHDAFVRPLEQLGGKIVICPDTHTRARMRYAKARGMITWCQDYEDLDFAADGFVLRPVRGIPSETTLYLARHRESDSAKAAAFTLIADTFAEEPEPRKIVRN